MSEAPTWKTKLKMAVLGPNAASATLLVCPTHAVSTCTAPLCSVRLDQVGISIDVLSCPDP